MTKPLLVLTDCYGGRGGIAQYNRYFVDALSQIKHIKDITILQRKEFYKHEKIPNKVRLVKNISNSKFKFFLKIINFLCIKQNYDLVFCCHIHLLPFAWLLSKRNNCPLILIIYGEEAWHPTKHKIANFLCRKVDTFITIRHYTAKQFINWSKIKNFNYFYIPNCINQKKFISKSINKKIIKKYKLKKKKLIISCGRMDIEDKNKGVDEILEILDDLSKKTKNLFYLVIGDGDDKKRLEKKAKSLKVDHLVLFLGNVTEKTKIDLFRLGHVFAMPGSRKSFDRYPFRFVNLEALSLGMHVICSSVNYKFEINDPNVKMLTQVNPSNKRELTNTVIRLFKKKRKINPLIKNFYFNNFKNKLESMINIIDDNQTIKKN